MSAIDLNADVGEGFGVWQMGDDQAIMALVSSANIATGFHAGDPSSIAEALCRAAAAGVVVGAHASYPDLVGFGRRAMDVSPAQLRSDVAYQIGALDGLARLAGTRVRYVKAHGALYNRLATDAGAAAAVASAIADFDPCLAWLCAPGSAAAGAGERAGLRVVAEAFADRAYLANGELAPRSAPGAVVSDRPTVVARAVRLATEGVVEAIDGTLVKLSAESICVHGDTAGAAVLAGAVRDGLTRAGLVVRSFITP